MTAEVELAPVARAEVSDRASELGSIRLLLRESRFHQALARCTGLLEVAPKERDALLFAAIAQRRLGQSKEAAESLDRLAEHHPGFSRLHEERGHWHAARRQPDEAIEAFQRAVQLNAALPASWHMLEGLYRIQRRNSEAQRAARELARLEAIGMPVVAAMGQFIDGDLGAAEISIRAFLNRQGNHIEAMRLLARIGMARRIFDDAELLLAAVLTQAPTHRMARLEYAQVLLEMHRYGDAKHELERLMREDFAHRLEYQGLYATACVGLGQHERAIPLYQELLRDASADADTHLSIGHAQKTLGRYDAAICSYRCAASARHDFGDAYWSLANLKTYRFTRTELERMEQMEIDPTRAVVDRVHFCFALGKAHEDERDYARAFDYYARGNALKDESSRYEPGIIEDNTARQKQICTAELFETGRLRGVRDASAIFIVGLPRSGSTLIEQILASHSSVEGTQELPLIQQMVAKLRGRDPDPRKPGYPHGLAQMGAETIESLGHRYLAGTQEYRSGSPMFIDKMPNNFRHLGLIRLMLPNAKIIDARREPMACGFGNFKQLFAQGQEFTYSLSNIARYYRTYLELMQHWDSVLPGKILRVQHEDLVDDLDTQVRRILEFCELKFEPACVSFHQTIRSVRTASSEQVRQPISRAGLEQWTHFEPWLAPLSDALGDARKHYRN